MLCRNIHVVQSTEATVESHELISVRSQLLNAQNNKPTMGIVQDALVGAYMLTSMDTFITRADFMQALMQLNHYEFEDLPEPAILKPVPLWTGKQLLSTILPTISMQKLVRVKEGNTTWKDALLSQEESNIIIKKGNLVAGKLCKETLGGVSGGIIQIGIKIVGSDKVLNFMSDCQRLVNHWLVEEGFSIGVSDCIIGIENSTHVNQVVHKCLEHAEKINEYGKKSGIGFKRRETQISNVLTKMHDITSGIIQKKIGHSANALQIMVDSGSKGNTINISQIIGCVGQQTINGQRIYDPYNKKSRILSHFPIDCDDVQSRGFVKNSYITGLSTEEMFFHTMGGREGIVDTSVKTATTGYLQRRLMKALEMLTIEYDSTVRDSYGNIFELNYGGDNYDAAWLEKVALTCITIPDDKMVQQFGNTTTSAYECVNFRGLLDVCRTVKHTFFSKVNPVVTLPVNINTLLLQCSKHKENVVHAEYVWEQVQLLIQWFERMRHNSIFMQVHLAFVLRSVNVQYITEQQFNNVVEHIKYYHHRAVAHAGEMVGVLAVQSIGEPCTQLTLNTVRYWFLIVHLATHTYFVLHVVPLGWSWLEECYIRDSADE